MKPTISNLQSPISNSDTPLRLVPHDPGNGYRFYVSNDGTIGLRIAPDGTQTIVNATPTTCENSKIQSDALRVQRYLQFCDAFGYHKHILVSHAVYLAWSGQRIPLYHQIHHLSGITTDNLIDNLLCVHVREHSSVADVRQRALKAIVPDGDLLAWFTYARLRELQDPRTMTDTEFRRELAKEQSHIQQQLALRDPILYHLSQSPDEC